MGGVLVRYILSKFCSKFSFPYNIYGKTKKCSLNMVSERSYLKTKGQKRKAVPLFVQVVGCQGGRDFGELFHSRSMYEMGFMAGILNNIEYKSSIL